MLSVGVNVWRSLARGGAPPPPDVLIPLNRITTWQPGVNYNGGIPAGRTQSGATISPIGQKATFTGTTANGSGTLTVTGVTGTLAADQLVFDAALTQCFGLIVSGGAGTWNFNDACRTTATAISMVSYGNDTTPINAALGAAGANTFVKLANGTFNIAANAISHRYNNVTLRGSSQWTGKEIVSGKMPSLTQTATTIIWKADHGLSPYGCLYVGFGSSPISWPASFNLASDGAKGATTITLTAPYSGAVGDLALLDQVGAGDVELFFGNRHDLSGTFTGSLSGSSLTVTAPLKRPLGVDVAFAGTFSGAALTVTSTSAFSFVNELGVSMNPNGVTVFDGSNNYYGTITGGAYPNFTMSQTNAGAHADLVLGGVIPQVNYPVFDGVFSTFYGFINGGTYPNFTMDRAVPTLTGVTLTIGGGSRRFFCRQDRPKAQTVRVASKAGNTVTFETPLHLAYQTAQSAQLTPMANPSLTGIGIEDLTLYWGIGGDGNGNLSMNNCILSWIKNVQSHFSDGTGIGFYGCYRCQMTQCYMHETPTPNPGGGGYLCGMNSATADSLFEDNEMWMGNKVIVMRGTGGGNVIAYNYMDDPLGGQYPMSPEAGVNAGHFIGSHMELMEGNYTHRYAGDSFWGNSPYLTVFRNWCSGLRAKANIHVNINNAGATTNAATAVGSNVLNFNSGDNQGVFVGHIPRLSTKYGVFPTGTVVTGKTATTVTLNNNVAAPGIASGDFIEFIYDGNLSSYTLLSGGTTFPYADSWGRGMMSIQTAQYNTNVAGNVLGYNGQTLLSYNSGGFNFAQTSFVYQNLGPTPAPTGTTVTGYEIGTQQNPNQTLWPPNGDATILRQGNWDWITGSQVWHGIGGVAGSGTPIAIPNSYYLSGVPAFFGANPWPWVNPATGATTVLPAKARFAARYATVPSVPPGNQ